MTKTIINPKSGDLVLLRGKQNIIEVYLDGDDRFWFCQSKTDASYLKWRAIRTVRGNFEYFFDEKFCNYQEFVIYLKDKYPEDLSWVLFHLEIFSGDYNE